MDGYLLNRRWGGLCRPRHPPKLCIPAGSGPDVATNVATWASARDGVNGRPKASLAPRRGAGGNQMLQVLATQARDGAQIKPGWRHLQAGGTGARPADQTVTERAR